VASTLGNAELTGSKILGLGTYRPRRIVPNIEICSQIDVTEEWIENRCGIRSRHYADERETLCFMAAEAGSKALAHAGITAAQLNCIVVASTSYLVQLPPLSIAVAHKIGAVNAGGFDVSAACAGFCHALAVAANMARCGDVQYVLVVGVERMTDIVDQTDRQISFLFADGAGAVVVGRSAEQGIGPTVRGADGASLTALRMNTSWSQFRADPSLPSPYLQMDGKRVFRWAVAEIVPAAQRALAAAEIDPGELSAFIPHQANLRMIQILAERLGLPDSVAVAVDVVHSGNTSAASVPLAMETLLSSGAVGTSDRALLMTFGAGLNYAGQVVSLP
jgi:3-oxoacyl-(acyl-carrier-protein) synthase III